MKFDFAAAARRHWVDAELLRDNERLGNADQLYGLTAECALKRLAIGQGWAQATADGDIDKQANPKGIRTHVDRLWPEVQARLAGVSARTWSLPAGANPFADWLVDQRYWADADTPVALQVAMHRAAAEAGLRALEQWALSGGTS